MISQSGRRSGAVPRITAHTARPITGIRSRSTGNFRFAITLERMAVIRIAATISAGTQSMRRSRGGSSRSARNDAAGSPVECRRSRAGPRRRRTPRARSAGSRRRSTSWSSWCRRPRCRSRRHWTRRRSRRDSRCGPCRWNTCRAIVPPISAAAILSRKLEMTTMTTSSAKAPSSRRAGTRASRRERGSARNAATAVRNP